MKPPPPLPAPPIGPGTTTGAGRRVDDGKGRVFPCERCGADVAFDVGTQSLRCPYCAHVTAIASDAARRVAEQDYLARLESLAKLRAGRAAPAPSADAGVSEVRCDGCGANVAFHGPLTSSACPFCGAPIQRDQVHDAADRVPVDGVLPFQVPEAKAREALRQWVASRWFAPNEFRKRGIEGRFAGVYVPFWTFDAQTFNRYVGERGEHYYVTVGVGKHRRTERRTRWWPARGEFRLFLDDVLVVAAKGLPTELLRKLEPWPLAKCRPYEPELLAGFLAQTYEVELEAGFREAKGRMEGEILVQTRREIGGDDQRVHSIESVFDPITYKHVLLPVWLLSYRWKETTYRVVVNAVTGEVQGTRPWSVLKIAVLCVVLAIGVGAIVAAAQR